MGAFEDLGGGAGLTPAELRALEFDRRVRELIRNARVALRRSKAGE